VNLTCPTSTRSARHVANAPIRQTTTERRDYSRDRPHSSHTRAVVGTFERLK
jgi:hypothetical protein